MGRKHLRVFTFQPPEVVEELLQTGVHVKRRRIARRADKTSLYREALGLPDDIYPIYTFGKLNTGRGVYDYPISVFSLVRWWARFMGWFKLDSRVLLELYVPSSVGRIGEVDKLHLSRLGSTEESTEFVLPLLRREWVKEVYTKDRLFSGYGKVLLTPTLLSHKDTLFKSPIHFSGDGYGEANYDLVTSSNPNDWLCQGLSYEDNLSRANSAYQAKLLVDLFVRSGDVKNSQTSLTVTSEIEKYWIKNRLRVFRA